MAASSRPALGWIEPCVNSRTVKGVPVPNPTWVSPSPAPRDWVTKSRNSTALVLKPGVFRFARLLPTTSIAVEVALSAERAVENDVVNIHFSVSRLRDGGACALCHELVQILADRRNILSRVDGLLQLLELRELRHKLCPVTRVQGVLVLQLGNQKL